MGRFFNKTRTPLSASTSKGRSITFPSRGWAYVPITEESSQAIQSYVRKGVLARADAPEDVALMAAASAPAAPAMNKTEVPAVAAWHTLEAEQALTGVVPVEDQTADVADVGSITSDVSTEVVDPSIESVASDSTSVADSQSRKQRDREHRRR